MLFVLLQSLAYSTSDPCIFFNNLRSHCFSSVFSSLALWYELTLAISSVIFAFQTLVPERQPMLSPTEQSAPGAGQPLPQDTEASMSLPTSRATITTASSVSCYSQVDKSKMRLISVHRITMSSVRRRSSLSHYGKCKFGTTSTTTTRSSCVGRGHELAQQNFFIRKVFLTISIRTTSSRDTSPRYTNMRLLCESVHHSAPTATIATSRANTTTGQQFEPDFAIAD